MAKSYQEQMEEIRAKRQAEFAAAQNAQNSNTPSSTEQPQVSVINNSQSLFDLNNIFAALLQPGGVQNFVQQNGGAEGIADKINQFTSQNSLPNIRPQDVTRASTLLSTFDKNIEPGIKPSGEFSKHDPQKVIATKEANVRKNLAEKIKLKGFTTELKKSVAELSAEAREKFIKHHVTNFDQNHMELKSEVIDFVKSGCLILDKSKGNVLGRSTETKQITEKSVEIEKSTNVKNEEKVDSKNLFDILAEAFNGTKSIEHYASEIKALNDDEASLLINEAFKENPELGGLIVDTYYQ